MKLRKLFTMLFLAFVALCLVACGSGSENGGNQGGENQGGQNQGGENQGGENQGGNQGGENQGDTENVEAKVQEYAGQLAVTFADGDSKDAVTKDVTLGTLTVEGVSVSWTSDNTAAIAADGKVTRGDEDVTVKLTATVTYKEKTASVDFTVVVKAVEKVKVNGITVKGATALETGAESTYAVDVLPADATDKEVTWSVSDEAVAVIDATGKLTAVKAGTVKVIATANDGSEVKGEIELVVSDPLPTEAVTIEAAKAQENGTYAYVEGVVVAVTARGYVLKDATGLIYVYAYGSESDLEKNFFYEEGEGIYVIGKMGFYNGRQIVPVESDYLLDELVLEEVVAEEIDAAKLDAYVAKPAEGETKDYENKLVAITGKLSVSSDGKYYNIVVEGTTNQGSISYITDAWKDKYQNGETYTFYGYTVGHSSNKYMNIALCNYEAPLPPFEEVYKEGALYVNAEFTAENCTWGGQTLTYGVNGFDKVEDAVKAAADYQTIYLQSGEYVWAEDKDTTQTIDKHLTFVGPNAEIPGYATKKYPEAQIKFMSSGVDINVAASMTFVGIQLTGNSKGYAAGVKFQGTDTTEGMVFVNCIIENANTWFKIQKAQADAKFYLDGCKVQGVGQFFMWVTTACEFDMVNSVFDASECGAVGNAAAALFRVRGADINVKLYGNTFIGDEAESNAGWFELDGATSNVSVMYNNFNLVTKFFYWHDGQTPATSVFDKNVVTDGDNTPVSELPTGYTEPGKTEVTIGTTTYETVDAMMEAYAADESCKVACPKFGPAAPVYDFTITGKVYGVGSSADTPNTSYFNVDAEANFLYVVDKATCAAQTSTFGYAFRIGMTYDAEKGCYVVDKIFTVDNTEAIKDSTSDFVLMYHSTYANKAVMDTLKVGDMVYANFDGLTAGPIDVEMGVVQAVVA